MEEEKKRRIEEIDKRIKDLEEQSKLWFKAGGVGGGMAVKAFGEINDLKMEKGDLLNGTNNLKISKLEARIRQLKALKESANYFKKFKYNSEIKEKEQEIESLKK